MNTKNLVLGFVAVVVAAGSAFSTAKFPPVPVYAKIKRQGATVFTPELVGNIDVTALGCSLSGSTACTVSVTIDLPAGTKVVTAYSDAAASSSFRAGSAIPISAYNPAGVAIIDASN